MKYPLGYFSKHTIGVLSELDALKRVNAEGVGWWWGRTSILRVSALYTRRSRARLAPFRCVSETQQGCVELFEQERARTSELAEIVPLHDDYTPLVERVISGQRPFTLHYALYERECMR